jgi:hypothetical protein
MSGDPIVTSRVVPFDPLIDRTRVARAATSRGDDADTQGFVLNPSVPLPGHYSFRRVVRINGLPAPGINTFTFKVVPAPALADKVDLQPRSGGGFQYNQTKALEFWKHQAIAAGLFRAAVDEAVAAVALPPPATARDTPSTAPQSRELLVLRSFLESLKSGRFELPLLAADRTASSQFIPPTAAPDPAFYLVEEYQVSSFATEYGLGRTIKTFTLLPGEETTLRLRTWRSATSSVSTTSTSTDTRSTSIIDSVDKSAIERFTSQLQTATTDKNTLSSDEQWHVEGEVGGGVGFVHANVKAGGGGDYRSGQEEFASRANQTVKEHAQESSNSRRNTVEAVTSTTSTSASSRNEAIEEENVVERTVKNINLRRVLNFVFRELNQQYEVFVHLRNVRVAFSTGLPGSWREAPLGLIVDLVSAVADVGPAVPRPASGGAEGSSPATESQTSAAAVAQDLLRLLSPMQDYRGDLVDVIEPVVLSLDNGAVAKDPTGRGMQLEAPFVDYLDRKDRDGFFVAPRRCSRTYRFKQGPLNQVDETNGTPLVDGLIVARNVLTMRTDSVIVEALLGFSDALDPYALRSQEASVKATELANQARELEQEKTSLALKTLAEIVDPKVRAELYARIFAPLVAQGLDLTLSSTSGRSREVDGAVERNGIRV